MQKLKDRNQEIRRYSAYKPFQDRRTDILAYIYIQSKGMAYGSLDQRKVVRKNLSS